MSEAPAPVETDPSAPGPAEPPPLPEAKLWLAAIGLALSNFVVVLDSAITNVSVPHIAGGLAVSPSQGTWTITSYAVAEAITVPLSGWLAARFGTLRTLQVATIGFSICSILCGLARTIEMLVLFRVLQGLCGGPLMPMTQTLLMRIFPRERIATANSIWVMTMVFAPIFGPLVGGWITENWSWPWIFYINLPINLASLVIVWLLLRPYETVARRERVDTVGLVLLVVFVTALQLMLDLGRDDAWFESTRIVVLGIVALLGFGAFVIWELTDSHPVVDLRVLRHRNLAVGMAVLSLGFGSIFAMVVIVPLWLQSVVGYTADVAGQSMAMIGVSAVMGGVIAGRLSTRVDLRLMVCVGMVWLVVVALWRTTWTDGGTFWDYSLAQFAQGFAMPLFFLGTMTMAMSAVPPREVASAAGILNFMRTISGAAAASLATASWEHGTRTMRDQLSGSLHGAEAVAGQIQDAGLSAAQGPALVEQLVDAQAATIGAAHVYGQAAAVLAATAVVIWFARRSSPGAMQAPTH